jgi:hypothetical protein
VTFQRDSDEEPAAIRGEEYMPSTGPMNSRLVIPARITKRSSFEKHFMASRRIVKFKETFRPSYSINRMIEFRFNGKSIFQIPDTQIYLPYLSL